MNDPQVVDEAFNNGDGAFTSVMRNVMVWQHPEPHQRVRNLVKAAFTPACDRDGGGRSPNA